MGVPPRLGDDVREHVHAHTFWWPAQDVVEPTSGVGDGGTSIATERRRTPSSQAHSQIARTFLRQ